MNYKYYKNKIQIFYKDITIKNILYKLIGIILMPTENHFICLFKNNNSIFNLKINNWYYFDDLTDILSKLIIIF